MTYARRVSEVIGVGTSGFLGSSHYTIFCSGPFHKGTPYWDGVTDSRRRKTLVKDRNASTVWTRRESEGN